MLILVLSSSITLYPLAKINIIFSFNDRNKKERVSEVLTRLRCGNEKIALVAEIKEVHFIIYLIHIFIINYITYL